MGVSILHSDGDGKAVLYDDTSDWAFGPVVSDCHHQLCFQTAEDILEDFLSWCERKMEVRDIRQVSELDLDKLYTAFMSLHNEHWCHECEGTGRVPRGGDEVTCGACEGAGKLGGKTHEDEAVERATGEVIR